MIATICKSCSTISRAIIDRCKYCGSRMVEVKIIDPLFVKPLANGRDVLAEFEQPEKKTEGLLK